MGHIQELLEGLLITSHNARDINTLPPACGQNPEGRVVSSVRARVAREADTYLLYETDLLE